MRSARQISALAAITVAGAFVGGCDTDTHKADKAIAAQVQRAIDHRSVNTPDENAKAQQAIDQAPKDGGSDGARAMLASMRAQMHVDAAMDLMYQIDKAELELASVAFDVGQLGVQLDAGNAMVNDYSRYDPAPIREKIQQQIVAAQGGNDQPTWEFQSMQMPTVAATRQKISELEGEIAKLQEQMKSLGSQRDEKLTAAEQAMQASEAAAGEQAIEEFKRASGLRKEAGNLFIQIDQLNAQMVPLQRDLAVAQGQVTVLQNIVQTLGEQQAALDAGWQEIKQQINAQKGLATQIVGSESAAAPAPAAEGAPRMSGATIAAKVAEINQIATNIRSMRQEAQSNLDDAASLFGKAYQSAESLRRTLQNNINTAGSDPQRPDVKAWKAMIDVMNPQVYRLREGAARRLSGSLYSSEIVSLRSRIGLQQSVAPVIESAGAVVPADLRPGNLARDTETAIKLGDEAYKSADDALQKVAEGVTSPEVKNVAAIERILTLYGWSQIAKFSDDNANAKSRLDEAIALRNNLLEQNIRLPALPSELGPPPRAAAPTTAPAAEDEAPATQPTDAPDAPEPDAPEPDAPEPDAPAPDAPAPDAPAPDAPAPDAPVPDAPATQPTDTPAEPG